MQVLTYKFRIKDGGSKRKCLLRWASAVNQVWNYCNEASFETLKKYSKWLSAYDLMTLTSGAGKDLGLNSQVVQQICKESARYNRYWTNTTRKDISSNYVKQTYYS